MNKSNMKAASLILCGLLISFSTQGAEIQRVSVDGTGAQSDDVSFNPSISADGRYVAFESSASNLVSDDTNGRNDIFVHDRSTGSTTRVSVDGNSAESDNRSVHPSISGDGRYVAFESFATNLVSDDTNVAWDIFVHDRNTGSTTRVSVDGTGAESENSSFNASISADGRYVAFSANATDLVSGDTNGFRDIFVHERSTGSTTRVSVDGTGAESEDGSFSASISADGRYVAFYSFAPNLVSGDTNLVQDIFVHDQGAACDSADALNQVLLTHDEWAQVAPPCTPPFGATISDLFGDDIGGELFDGSNGPTASYAVYFYDVSEPSGYRLGAPNDVVLPGEGLWIKQVTGSDVTVDVPEGSRSQASLSYRKQCTEGNVGCVSLASNSDTTSDVVWTMMGLPLIQQGDVAFSDQRILTNSGVCSDADGCTPAEANTAQVMSNSYFHYNPANLPTLYDTTTDGDTLNRWEAHWVGVYPNAGPLEPVVLFPELRVAELSLSAANQHEFPAVIYPGGSETETFTVTNTGDAMATMSIGSNLLTNLPIIMVPSQSSCDAFFSVLASGASCDVQVGFFPSPINFPGLYQNTMTVSYESLYGPVVPNISKALRGRVLAP